MIPFFTALLVALVMVTLYIVWVYLKRRSIIREAAANWRKISAEAIERAEELLRASISADEYAHLLQHGYLEIPSKLYTNRVYQIPRKRQRVRVYEVVKTGTTEQKRRLGELCLIARDPVPDADLVLAHKWLLEANEERYLAAANWVNDSYTGQDGSRLVVAPGAGGLH
jgi:hypothetical protein